MKTLLQVLVSVMILGADCNNTAIVETLKKETAKNEDNFVSTELFELNQEPIFKGDTLWVVTCADMVFNPFGELNAKEHISNSTLAKFEFTNVWKTVQETEYEFQVFKIGNSSIVLFFDNDPEASRHSSIFQGIIKDKELKYANEICVGMPKEKFLNKLFISYPTMVKNCNTIVFESCVSDILHIYSFGETDFLDSIKFISDTYWVLDFN